MTSDSGSRSESRDVKQARPVRAAERPAKTGIAHKLKMLIGQYKLSKDVSLRRKLIGVEYEKRYLAGKKGWAHRRSADRAGVPSGLSLQAVSGKAAHPLRGDA